MIIQLPHGLTKFKNISIKSYFINSISIDDHQLIPNSSAPTQVSQPKILLADIPAKVYLVETLLSSLALIKHGNGGPRKYQEQVKIVTTSDICFIIDEFDIFNKNTDIQPAQYTASRQKKIVGLWQKDVFIVVTTVDIPSNAQFFNSRFIEKMKIAGTNKGYEKHEIVIQAYNDQKKDLVLT